MTKVSLKAAILFVVILFVGTVCVANLNGLVKISAGTAIEDRDHQLVTDQYQQEAEEDEPNDPNAPAEDPNDQTEDANDEPADPNEEPNAPAEE